MVEVLSDRFVGPCMMRLRISIRGRVCPFVRPSVCPDERQIWLLMIQWVTVKQSHLMYPRGTCFIPLTFFYTTIFSLQLGLNSSKPKKRSYTIQIIDTYSVPCDWKLNYICELDCNKTRYNDCQPLGKYDVEMWNVNFRLVPGSVSHFRTCDNSLL